MKISIIIVAQLLLSLTTSIEYGRITIGIMVFINLHSSLYFGASTPSHGHSLTNVKKISCNRLAYTLPITKEDAPYLKL